MGTNLQETCFSFIPIQKVFHTDHFLVKKNEGRLTEIYTKETKAKTEFSIPDLSYSQKLRFSKQLSSYILHSSLLNPLTENISNLQHNQLINSKLRSNL